MFILNIFQLTSAKNCQIPSFVRDIHSVINSIDLLDQMLIHLDIEHVDELIVVLELVRVPRILLDEFLENLLSIVDVDQARRRESDVSFLVLGHKRRKSLVEGP